MNDHSVVAVIRQWMRSAKWGVITMGVVNLSAAFTGFSLGFSWLSGGVAIALGTPGVILLLLIHAFLLVG